jgi:uncharacterized alpha-E superfamily protein
MLSRVAENLYWMARYVERAEHTSRLLAVKLESMAEQSGEAAEAGWSRIMAALAAEQAAMNLGDALLRTEIVALDRTNPSSLLISLSRARDNARQARDQLSTEVWESLNRLYLRVRPLTIEQVWVHEPHRIFRETLQNLHAVEGVVHSTLRHGEGWYFLELGRYIERAQLVSRLLGVHFPARGTHTAPAPPTYLDWLLLLKFCCAFEPYLKEHTAAIIPSRVAGFLLFDAEFPRSVKFAVGRVSDALLHVAQGAPPQRRAACERLAGRLKAAIDFGQIDEMMEGSIAPFMTEITRQCEEIHDAVHAAYIAYGAAAVA